MLTDAHLQGIAKQALNLAARDIEQAQFNFLLASYHESDKQPLRRMRTIETLIVERLGEKWLESGKTKDMGFSMLSMAVAMLPPDAVVFVTAANGFVPTDKFRALTLEQQLDLLNKGHDTHHRAVRDGLFTLDDMLAAVVQTAERVCLCNQSLDPRGRLTGTPSMQCVPQEQFDGRMKMFGKGNHAFSW